MLRSLLAKCLSKEAPQRYRRVWLPPLLIDLPTTGTLEAAAQATCALGHLAVLTHTHFPLMEPASRLVFVLEEYLRDQTMELIFYHPNHSFLHYKYLQFIRLSCVVGR